MESHYLFKYNSTDPDRRKRKTRRSNIALILCGALVFLIILAVIASLLLWFFLRVKELKSINLYSKVSASSAESHLQELFNIAGKNNNSRSVEFGFNASRDYVKEQLNAAQYSDPVIQEFSVPIYTQLDTPTFRYVGMNNFQRHYTLNVDFALMRYSASGNLTIFSTNFIENSCDASSYGNVNNTMLVVNYDDTNCSVFDKVVFAQNANASCLLMARSMEGSGVVGTRLLKPNSVEHPSILVMSITRYVADELKTINFSSSDGTYLEFYASTEVVVYATSNLIVDLYSRQYIEINNLSTIMIGAHLDSVSAGPGINDNGSGSAGILEVAIKLKKYLDELSLKFNIRFAWWGAEELGLLGSSYYVDNLTEKEKREIKYYLNFDMIASPNFILSVYNGTQANESIRGNCEQIMNVLSEGINIQYGSSYNITTVDLGTRSDYYSFLNVGIAAGAVATGADGAKTSDERTWYGGIAGAIYDPCYHKECDTLDNVNMNAYEIMLQAIAYATQTLAEGN